MVNNIPVNGWPQLKDLEAVQPILNRLDKIEAWKRTVKEETFTGDDITIENALALPARSLITEINAIQDLHGYDKPWAGGAGKNKWPFGDFNGTYSNVPFSLAAGTYTASKINPDVNCGLRFYYADDTSIAFTFFTSETFTLTADVVKINYSSADAMTENFMIESGTTATSFAPYSNICPISGRDSVVLTRSDGDEISEDFTIQLGTTVYGAEINWDTGAMTVKTALVDLGTLYWEKSAGAVSGVYRFFTVQLQSLIKDTASTASAADLLTSDYPAISFNDANNGAYGIYEHTNKSVGVCDSRYYNVDIAEFKSAMNGVKLCYPLATPTTIQLTPTQLEMLKGYNHITLSDGYGTIELKALTGANWS